MRVLRVELVSDVAQRHFHSLTLAHSFGFTALKVPQLTISLLDNRELISGCNGVSARLLLNHSDQLFATSALIACI